MGALKGHLGNRLSIFASTCIKSSTLLGRGPHLGCQECFLPSSRLSSTIQRAPCSRASSRRSSLNRRRAHGVLISRSGLTSREPLWQQTTSNSYRPLRRFVPPAEIFDKSTYSCFADGRLHQR